MFSTDDLKIINTPEVKLGKIHIGGNAPLTLMAGPCVLEPGDEGKKMHDQVAETLVELKSKLKINVVFKASFDKANRTSISSYRGEGLDQSIKEFDRIKSTYDIPVISDIHTAEQAHELKDILDILQVPAFLCRQTDMIVAAANTQKVVMIKKGQFIAPHDIEPIVNKFKSAGNNNLIVCDRGYTFGYNRLINDFGGLYEMRKQNTATAFDATHSVQEPGAKKNKSGGHPVEIPALVRAACSVGIDALFMETHPNPEKAMSDATTVFPLELLSKLIENAVSLHNAVRQF